MDVRTLFFEDLADSLDRWAKTAANALTKEDARLGWTDAPDDFRAVRAALRQADVSPEVVVSVVRNALRGFTHSVLLIIDGATQLADHSLISIVDEQGNSLGEALHDYFAMYLAERDRSE